jgi:cytochrome oxidase Cu insertion factor (SCO1/SenC/PrrC family)
MACKLAKEKNVARRAWIPILLWTAVLVFGAWIFLNKGRTELKKEAAKIERPPANGVVLVDVPWKYLPELGRFKLTDQTGADFDSASLSGRMTAVCFLFYSFP